MQELLAGAADAVRAGDDAEVHGYEDVFNALPEPLTVTTIAEFVPAVFDVEGDGSCYFYSLAYTVPHPPLPHTTSTAFGPIVEYAHDLRRTSINMIERDIVDMTTRYRELIEYVDIDPQFLHACRHIRTELNYMLSECNDAFLFPVSDDTLVIDHDIIQQRLQRMRQTETTPHFSVIASIASRVAQIFPHNIVTITVPHSWIVHEASTEYVGNQGCSVVDVTPGYEYAQSHGIHPTSIFVLYTGGHYMRIVFLNTDAHAPDDMRVIDHVPSWDRARWVDMFAAYWGFPQIGWSNIRVWRDRNECMYRSHTDVGRVCRLPLGHSGVHACV